MANVKKHKIYYVIFYNLLKITKIVELVCEICIIVLSESNENSRVKNNFTYVT